MKMIYQYHKPGKDDPLWILSPEQEAADDYAKKGGWKPLGAFHPSGLNRPDLSDKELQAAGVDVRMEYQCTQCHSPDVYADAWASLNDESDVRTYDAMHCDGCEGECKVDLFPVHLVATSIRAMRKGRRA